MKRTLLFLLILLTATSQCSAYTTYTNISFYNVSANDVIALGSEYNGSDLVSIEATIIDDSTKVNPYDINRTDLVLELHLNGGINDTSGYGNNGTENGALTYVNGKHNESVLIDGPIDYINLGNDSSLKNDFPVTISVYAKYFGSGNNSVYASDVSDDDYYGYWIQVTDKAYIAYGTGGVAQSSTRRTYATNNTFDTNIFHNFVFIINGIDDVEIYVDGDFEGGTFSGTGASYSKGTTNPALVAGQDYSNAAGAGIQTFNGTIDELLIWARAITVDEIQNNYIDKLSQFQLNTTSNTTLSTFWNSSSDNPKSIYFDAFELFSSIIPTVPSSILSNGTTVYDYQNSTQFDINISLGIDNADVLNLTIINETQSLLYFNITYTADYPIFNIAWDGKANNGTANTSTLYYQNGTSITSNSTYVANSVLLVPSYLLPSDTTYYIQESTTWTLVAGSIFADIINTIYYNGTVTYNPQPTQSSINLSAIFEPRMEVL